MAVTVWPHRNPQRTSPTLDRRQIEPHTGLVARRLWGCYSVRDHLEPRAFVADLLLYDRLVVPVPPEQDLGRWAQLGWNPDRQKQLLDIAGPFVERVIWDDDLRAEFNDRFSPAIAAAEIDSISRVAAGLAAWELTRQMITERIRGDVLRESPEGDIRAVSVYAQPDRFDREWRIDGIFPFFHRSTKVAPGRLREVHDVAPASLENLAHLVVTRLVVPNDGREDTDVLEQTVALIMRKDVSDRRAEFQKVLAQFHSLGLKDETIVGEIDDLLTAYNDVIRKHSKATKARAAIQMATTAEAAAALWAPPVALAVGPTTAAGEAFVRRNWSEDAPSVVNAVSLLAEAQAALEP
jgi:hypothetical protein